MNGMSKSLSILHERNTFRIKIILYAGQVDEFTVHQVYDWYFENYPREVPPKNRLSAFLGKIDCIEKIGYKTIKRQRNMRYKLREDYALDRKIQTE
mgnify:CR=1 FL=1